MKAPTFTPRTFEELEAALDNHQTNRLHHLTLAAIEAGNSSDAGHFAASLTHHVCELAADVREFGDEPVVLADFRDERARARQAITNGDGVLRIRKAA